MAPKRVTRDSSTARKHQKKPKLYALHVRLYILTVSNYMIEALLLSNALLRARSLGEA